MLAAIPMQVVATSQRRYFIVSMMPKPADTLLVTKADLAEPEESQPGRVEPADDLAAEHAGVEVNGTVQVVGVLRYLVQFHDQPRSPEIDSIATYLDRHAIHMGCRLTSSVPSRWPRH